MPPRKRARQQPLVAEDPSLAPPSASADDAANAVETEGGPVDEVPIPESEEGADDDVDDAAEAAAAGDGKMDERLQKLKELRKRMVGCSYSGLTTVACSIDLVFHQCSERICGSQSTRRRVRISRSTRLRPGERSSGTEKGSGDRAGRTGRGCGDGRGFGEEASLGIHGGR